MNIEFVYQYRDGANYKKWNSIIFSNPNNLPLSELHDVLSSHFIGEEFFIAHQIGIKELFFYKEMSVSVNDHCYHEYLGVELTEQEAIDKRSVDEFVQEIEQEAKRGWLAFSPVGHCK